MSHLSAQTARNVVLALRVTFSRLGIPSKVKSDNGGCFASEEFCSFVKELGFTNRTSSPRYPQLNNLAEHAVGIVKRSRSKAGNNVTAHRSTPLKSRFSPAQLLYGRSVRTQLGKLSNTFVDYELLESCEKKYSISAREVGVET